MDVEDYIRIRGNDWDAAPFQGIGGGECAGTPNVEPGEVIEPVMTAIDAGLWQAQTATISGERVYLAALNQQFRDTQAFLEDGAFKDGLMLLKEIGEEALSQRLTAYLLKTAAASLGATGAALIALLVPAIIDFGISKAIDWLADYLKEGNKLIDALMAEDEALLAVQPTREHYDIRNVILDRHQRQIDMLLRELHLLKDKADPNQAIAPQCDTDSTENLERILEKALLSFEEAFLAEKINANGAIVKDADGNPVLEGFLDERLKDLKYNDEVIDIGDVRILHKSRVIEYS